MSGRAGCNRDTTRDMAAGEAGDATSLQRDLTSSSAQRVGDNAGDTSNSDGQVEVDSNQEDTAAQTAARLSAAEAMVNLSQHRDQPPVNSSQDNVSSSVSAHEHPAGTPTVNSQGGNSFATQADLFLQNVEQLRETLSQMRALTTGQRDPLTQEIDSVAGAAEHGKHTEEEMAPASDTQGSAGKPDDVASQASHQTTMSEQTGRSTVSLYHNSMWTPGQDRADTTKDTTPAGPSDAAEHSEAEALERAEGRTLQGRHVHTLHSSEAPPLHATGPGSQRLYLYMPKRGDESS